MGYKILDVKADIHEEVEAFVDALYGYDEDKEEAEEHSRQQDHYIQFRAGTDVRCENYCDVADFCSQYQNTIKGV